VSSPSWHQFLTIAGTLAVVNSILIGATPGLAVQARTGTLALAGYLRRVITTGAEIMDELFRGTQIRAPVKRAFSSKPKATHDLRMPVMPTTAERNPALA
jgi:hypothetical protein